MTLIDLRCRPAYLHDFFGANPGSPGYATARWLNRRVGTRGSDEHFARSLTHEGFLAEIDDAGLSHAVVVGRHTPSQHLPNDRIHEIVRDSPRLLGVGAVDPGLQGAGAIDEAVRAIEVLKLVGINIEPGFGDPPRHPDDPIYDPIYETARDRGVPVFLMSGPTTPDLRFNDPAPLARVAQRFPSLPLVAYHGYYPNVQQLVGVAFRYDNVYLVPDMYLFQPGSQVIVEAANSFLSEQVLFGSSYPFRPIAQSIEDARLLGFRSDVLRKFLGLNAARLLKLER